MMKQGLAMYAKWGLGLFVFLAAAPLHAGNENGNGGDPLRDLFSDGRSHAAARVLSLLPCSFRADTAAETRRWVIEHKEALARDILSSRHTWVTDTQSTCAYTHTVSQADITLSFQVCGERVKSIVDAGRMLLHESVHHFGISDEAFADEVAAAVYLAEPASACPLPISDDPFDSNSCAGAPLTSAELFKMIPLPNANERLLGRFKVSQRMRVCYTPEICTGWVESDAHGIYLNFNGGYQPVAMEGRVTALLHSNIPMVSFESEKFLVPGWNAPWTYSTASSISGTRLTSIPVRVRNAVESSGSVGVFTGERTPLIFEGMMTRECLRVWSRATRSAKDSQNNDTTHEYEVVLHSRFE
jgi:hypothetical protein